MFENASPNTAPRPPKSIIQRILPFTTVAIVIAALYVGYTFYSRWNDERQGAADAEEKQRETNRRTVEMMGGGEFKILHFYASPGAIRRGDHATVCYGVSAAKTVRIEPDVEAIKPALTNCLEISPKKTTQYTLTAEDGKGHSVNSSFTLQVVP